MILLLVAMALQSTTPPFRVVAKGAQSGVEVATQVVVRTADEWTALWRRQGMNRQAPPVDFGRETIVGVFMGSRPTAGFDVEIVGVADQDGARVVRYRETSPRPDALTAQVLTSPYVLVAIPKSGGEVRFEKVPGER